MTDIFNNREIATGAWLIIGLLLCLRSKSVRGSFGHMGKAFFQIKVIIPIFLMAMYVGGSVILLYRLKLWNFFLLKDTIYWFLFSGFVLFMNLVTSKFTVEFFKKTFIGCFQLIVFIEFLLNFYTLPLLAELFLVPIVTILLGCSAVSANKPEFKSAKIFIDSILALIVLALFIFVARSIYQQYVGLLKLEVLLSILLPICLTVLFIPFIYFAKLVFDYEVLFVRLPVYVKNEELLSYAKKKIVLLCHIDLRKLNRFSKEMSRLWAIENKDDIDRIFRDYRSGVSASANKCE